MPSTNQPPTRGADAKRARSHEWAIVHGGAPGTARVGGRRSESRGGRGWYRGGARPGRRLTPRPPVPKAAALANQFQRDGCQVATPTK